MLNIAALAFAAVEVAKPGTQHAIDRARVEAPAPVECVLQETLIFLERCAAGQRQRRGDGQTNARLRNRAAFFVLIAIIGFARLQEPLDAVEWRNAGSGKRHLLGARQPVIFIDGERHGVAPVRERARVQGLRSGIQIEARQQLVAPAGVDTRVMGKQHGNRGSLRLLNRVHPRPC